MPDFDKYSPDDMQYRQTLHKQLTATKDLRYWIKEYKEQNGKSYLYTYVQGGNVCAIGVFDISNTQKLENLRQAKGQSYSGAEITDLQYDVVSDSNGYHYVLKDYGHILD
ncbi:hypothetical protein CAP35_14980 [Chitinophagaceae bacterium IBVUCB1]|nr:hypothetical protein CAP35_14980 [Chitinophagaceae bacterium IBVUCB1]